MKNYSYVTYLTDDSYAYGVILLKETLDKTQSKYPLHVLITEDVSTSTVEILEQLKVSYELVEKILLPEHIHQSNLQKNKKFAITWQYCLTQLQVFNLKQFDKIVFLDADIMILKNIDHLFELPHLTAAMDGEYFNIYPDYPHFNSGCMVIEPSEIEFNNIQSFIKGILPGDQIIANQEILNLYYKDWINNKELHLNKYYNIFGPYVLKEHLKDIQENAYFIHFVGRKPWKFFIKPDFEDYEEYFYDEAKKIIVDKVNALDWNEIRSKIVLTVYSICKNEIRNVEKFINSFKEADYLCILDTGSTDGTWEFLQKAQKKIPNLIVKQEKIHPWRFDKARNESMKLIPKETIMFFMADLDEVIKEAGWSQKIKDVWEPNFDRGQYTYNREVGINDIILKQMKEYRIHSKNWKTWINIVHEALINNFGEKTFYVETSTPVDITVWHYNTKIGKTNYMELCEQDLEEKPDDWVMRLQLAIEYEIREELEKAYYHFKYILEHKNTLQYFEIARCYFGLGRYYILKGDLALALFYFGEGRIIDPTCADNYFSAAEIFYNNKDYVQAIELCKQGFLYCEQTKWCGVIEIQSYYPYQLLGMSYFLNGQEELGLSYVTIAYSINKDIKLLQLQHDMIQSIVQKRKKREAY